MVEAREPGSSPLDVEVRELMMAGNSRGAADLLLTQLSPELRPFLHRLLGNITLADEAHCATCERMWRGLPNFRWECSLRTWSYIIARREASRCRKHHAQAGAEHTTLSAAERLADGATVLMQTVPNTQNDLFEVLRASLSDEDRDLLVLRVERGLAWKEIATAFLEDEETSAETLAREAARLRQRFRTIRVSAASALLNHRRNREQTP